MEHKVIPAGERHGPHQWVVANEAARLALTPTSNDLGSYCWQQSDNTEWMLLSIGPATWQERGAPQITVSDTPPEDPVLNQLWLNTAA